MPSMGFSWEKSIAGNATAGALIFLSMLESEMGAVAREMEQFAKQNHPWKNQTGEAERTFTVRVVNRSTIEARHGVPYGIWLEVKYGGRWGIIPATMDFGRSRIVGAGQKAWARSWHFV